MKIRKGILKKWSHYCLEQIIIPESNGLTLLMVKTSLGSAVRRFQL
jgi:hypothetical protein